MQSCIIICFESKKSQSSFQVSIHDPLTPADLRSEGVEVEPGYVSTILITPKQEIMHDGGEYMNFIIEKELFYM